MNKLIIIALASALFTGCVAQREWAATKIRPAAGLVVDMIELKNTSDQFADIYKPFYEGIKESGLTFTPEEKATLETAHNSLIVFKGYVQALHDSARNPREASIQLDQLRRMVEPVVSAVNDAKPIFEKQRANLSIEYKAKLDALIELFDQAAMQAQSIAESETGREAQRKITNLYTVGKGLVKLALIL